MLYLLAVLLAAILTVVTAGVFCITAAINPAFAAALRRRIKAGLITGARRLGKALIVLCFLAAAQIVWFPGALAQAPSWLLGSANILGLCGLMLMLLWGILSCFSFVRRIWRAM